MTVDGEDGAGRLRHAFRDRAGLAVERLPGLACALDRFLAEMQRNLAPLLGGAASAGTIEPARTATLFQAIGDCHGLTAAIYASQEPEARLLIALDERIDDLIVSTVFGGSLASDVEDEPQGEATKPRTPIETALVEEFARLLGSALEAAFAQLGSLSIAFERLATLTDVHALGRRDMPCAAARFSLPMSGAACECLILIPQSLLLPFRKELEREGIEPPRTDRRWSLSMETGVKQARLPITAILEELPMSLGEVAQFCVGKVLPLQTNGFDLVRLDCGGRGMFLCKLGQGEGRYRLEVDLPIRQDVDDGAI